MKEILKPDFKLTKEEWDKVEELNKRELELMKELNEETLKETFNEDIYNKYNEEINRVRKERNEIMKVENEGTLTDEQVDQIVEVLHPKEGEKEPEHFPYHVINKEGLVSAMATVEIDPKTGQHKVLPAEVKNNKVGFGQILDNDLSTMDNISAKSEKDLKDFGIPEEECMDFFNVLMKFKNNEKFNIYAELPKTGKQMVENLAMSKDIRVLNNVAKGMLGFFLNEFDIEKEFIDLQESIDEELQFKGIADIYVNEQLLQSMEVDLLKKADEYEEKGDTKKAESLRELSKTFTDTYKMTKEHEELDKNPRIVKKIDKELSKFNKHCMEFNFKYQDSKFVINDIKLLVPCLTRLLPEYNEIDIHKFILLITNICRDMTPKDPIQHSFMYYTVRNILILEHVKDTNEFRKRVIENIKGVINKIKKIEDENGYWMYIKVKEGRR